ncbi:hypothetical protein E2320_012770 [Naja naja]|nr:hypothetical protein E2320_012770 [Naja naja]
MAMCWGSEKQAKHTSEASLHKVLRKPLLCPQGSLGQPSGQLGNLVASPLGGISLLLDNCPVFFERKTVAGFENLCLPWMFLSKETAMLPTGCHGGRMAERANVGILSREKGRRAEECWALLPAEAGHLQILDPALGASLLFTGVSASLLLKIPGPLHVHPHEGDSAER